MNREEKYPETDVFHFHNENPFGKYTGDCAYRAIAAATGKTWSEVLQGMYEIAQKTGYAVASKQNIDRYLKSIGWRKQKQPKCIDGSKLTGKAFCRSMKDPASEFSVYKNRNLIANIGTHHIVAICKGKIFDTWDSSGRCVGNYWEH